MVTLGPILSSPTPVANSPTADQNLEPELHQLMKQSAGRKVNSDSSGDIAICYLDKSSAQQHLTQEQEQQDPTTERIENFADRTEDFTDRNEELTDRMGELPVVRESREVTTIQEHLSEEKDSQDGNIISLFNNELAEIRQMKNQTKCAAPET